MLGRKNMKNLFAPSLLQKLSYVNMNQHRKFEQDIFKTVGEVNGMTNGQQENPQLLYRFKINQE